MQMAASKISDEQELWQEWLSCRDGEAANQLIENYMYLVNFQVERIASSLPSSVSKEDLKSFGLLGLFDALKKFEPDRNLKFDTYASFRVRGAIIDGLRKEDWLPRSLRDKSKKVEQAIQVLEQTLQRAPDVDEIASETGLAADEIRSIMKDAVFSNIWSLEEKPNDSAEGSKEGIGYLIEDEAALPPDENLLKQELKKELAESMKSLSENEQLVISLFYQEELTFTEVGHIMGLTTSRISQIHKKAIFKLRNSLEKMQALAQ